MIGLFNRSKSFPMFDFGFTFFPYANINLTATGICKCGNSVA